MVEFVVGDHCSPPFPSYEPWHRLAAPSRALRGGTNLSYVACTYIRTSLVRSPPQTSVAAGRCSYEGIAASLGSRIRADRLRHWFAYLAYLVFAVATFLITDNVWFGPVPT